MAQRHQYNVRITRTIDGMPCEPSFRTLGLFDVLNILCDDWFGAVHLKAESRRNEEDTWEVFSAACLNARDTFYVSGATQDLDVLMHWFNKSSRRVGSGLHTYNIGSARNLREAITAQMEPDAKQVNLLHLLPPQAFRAVAELVLFDGQNLGDCLELARAVNTYNLNGTAKGLENVDQC